MATTTAESAQVWRDLAHRLDVERRRLALSRTDLASGAEVSFGTIQRVLAGTPIHMSALRRIVEALGMQWAAVITAVAAPPEAVESVAG